MTKRFSVEYRVAALTFFSSLYFYSHVGTLYLQDRGLTLFQVNSLSALIIGTIFLTEGLTELDNQPTSLLDLNLTWNKSTPSFITLCNSLTFG